jgi:hypothetical protein
MTIGRHALAAASLLAALAAAGCSDDPEPKFEPDPSPTASSSSAAPESEPWEKQSDAGAVAFAKHWVDVFTHAMNGGASDDLRSISGAQCEACGAIADRIDAIEADGGFYRSPGWTVLQAVPAEGMPAEEAVVSLRVLQGRETYKESADSEIVRNPESKAVYSARMAWSGGAWKMTELRLAT